jgi:hypothetical protein
MIAQQKQLMEVLLTVNFDATASSSGVLSISSTNNPIGSTEWLATAGLWEEYRFLATEFVFVPLYTTYSTSTTTQTPAPLVLWNARDSTISIPTSYNTAWQIGSAKMFHTSRISKTVIRMSGVPEGGFTNTSAPISSAVLGAYADGLTVALKYGTVFVRWLVQFRGRR